MTRKDLDEMSAHWRRRSTSAPTRSPDRRPRCARRWPRLRSATTSTARIRAINRLQDQVAAMLGKEAALWLPSGTMANQVALRVLTRPGDDVDRQPREPRRLARDRRLGGECRRAAHRDRRPRRLQRRRSSSPRSSRATHGIYPPTTLVEIENTHNRAGGVDLCRRTKPSGSAPRRGSAASPASSTARGSGTPRSRPASALDALARPVRPGRRVVLEGAGRARRVAARRARAS